MYRLRSFIWLKFNTLLAPAFAKDTLIEIPAQASRFYQGNSSLSDWDGFIRANHIFCVETISRNDQYIFRDCLWFALMCQCLMLDCLLCRLQVRSEINVKITPATAKNYSQIRDADERAECRNFRERSITVSG